MSWRLPHFSSPGIGRVESVGDVVTWQPIPQSSRIAQIDARTRRTGVFDFETGSGSSRCDYMPAVMSYFVSFGQAEQIVFRHQGGAAVYGDGASCDNDDVLLPLDGVTSTREGSAPSWDWVFDQLQHGRGVFVSVGFYDAAGVRAGGHALRIWGARRFDGRDYFYTLDDSDQGLNSAGLQTTQWEVSDQNGPGQLGTPNGVLEFDGTSKELEFVLSMEARPTLLIQ